MDKKGLLLAEETLKIVIAVICIVFLVYLLFHLYYNSINNQKLELAKASLEYLISEIESETAEVQIFDPSSNIVEPDWIVIGWTDNGISPNTCENVGWENCLCICKEPKTEKIKFITRFFNRIQRYAERCDDIGICMETKQKFSTGDYGIKIENPPIILQINYEKGEINKK